MLLEKTNWRDNAIQDICGKQKIRGEEKERQALANGESAQN